MSDERRGRSGPAVIVMGVALVVSGCFPISPVASRPAAVRSEPGGGGGGVMLSFVGVETEPSLADTDEPFPFGVCFLGEWGLGCNMDLAATFDTGIIAAETGIAGMGVLSMRVQVLGLPYESGAMVDRTGCPFDCSLEIGGGFGADTFRKMSVASAYAAVNISKPLGGVTPFFCYRYYRNVYDYREENDEGFNNLEVYVLGVEITREEALNYMVEIYYGQPPGGVFHADEKLADAGIERRAADVIVASVSAAARKSVC